MLLIITIADLDQFIFTVYQNYFITIIKIFDQVIFIVS